MANVGDLCELTTSCGKREIGIITRIDKHVNPYCCNFRRFYDARIIFTKKELIDVIKKYKACGNEPKQKTIYDYSTDEIYCTYEEQK